MSILVIGEKPSVSDIERTKKINSIIYNKLTYQSLFFFFDV